MKFSDYDPWRRPDAKQGQPSKTDKPNGKEPASSRRKEQPRPERQDPLDMIFDLLGSLLGGRRGKKDESRKGGGGFKSFGAIGMVLLLVWGAMGFYVVDEQERGVVLRFGKYYSVLTPGLKWQPYFVDRVIVLNVTQVRSFSSRGIMLTKDENIVDITVNVQYVIDQPKDFVINTRDPELSLRQATDSSLRHVVGSTIMDQVITEGRAAVAVAVAERIQNYITNYGTGILVSQVSIQRADPPEQVKASFEDVISAREDKVRFINQATAYSNGIIPQARGEARRILEEGEAYKRDKIARASGQAERFNLVYQEYVNAPLITRQRLYLEAMEEVLANSNKILIDVQGGNNNLLYLPLDQLIGQTGTGAARQLGSEAPISNAPPQNSIDRGQSVNDIVNRVLEEIRRSSNSRTR